jgi:demethylmenaquinone methyltransferase/2-methoxy-6-polyprenyl-1,4-benzoquinol methylase
MSDTSTEQMKRYYRERAPVYERVYSYPERQADLRILEQYATERFAGKDVLEIAAGTGYWTRFISRRANSLLAIDATPQALARIDIKSTKCRVETRVEDAYTLDSVDGRFDAAFAGLWFSHVPVERRLGWLAKLHARLCSGATVLLLDNSRRQCERLPISRTDDQGNTYQWRETDSCQRYEVLKNFPTEAELLELTAAVGREHRFEEMDHFWTFEYKTK